jgi:Tol biopolymer transport system component
MPGDTNDVADIFVRDRWTGRTERVSVGAGGALADGWSESPAISADGRLVAFASWANNMVSGDADYTWDVFVRDRQTGRTERVSVSAGGASPTGSSVSPAISGDGRFVAFQSTADNLVPGGTTGEPGVFLRDRESGTTQIVSIAHSGAQANGWSGSPAISGDGRLVAFASVASNLVAGDTNGRTDVFVAERE